MDESWRISISMSRLSSFVSFPVGMFCTRSTIDIGSGSVVASTDLLLFDLLGDFEVCDLLL